MVFFDYDRNGKKDWKDNAREYYLYNKLKEDMHRSITERRKNHPMMGNQMLGVVLYYCVFYLCFV